LYFAKKVAAKYCKVNRLLMCQITGVDKLQIVCPRNIFSACHNEMMYYYVVSNKAIDFIVFN